jgi:hypothetical protein
MIENRLRLERQILLGRQAVAHAQQSLSRRGSKDLLPSTSAGHQNSMIGAMRSLAEESDDDGFDTRTPDAPEGWTAPSQPAEPQPSSDNASFLSRLRTQSFPGFTSRIRRKGRLFTREGKVGGQAETSGSSDSSSAEDQPQRPAFHPSALRSRADVRQIFTDRRAGAGDDGSDGDQEDEEL